MTTTPGENLDAAIAAYQVRQGEQDTAIRDLGERVAALEGGTPPPEPTPEPSDLVYGYGHSNRAKLENDTGVLVCADRIFEGGSFYSSWSQTDSKDLPSRYRPIMSMKCSSWADAAAGRGRWQDDFRTFVKSVPREIDLIVNHEPDNDGRNPDDFVGMTQAFGRILAEEEITLVRYGLCLMTSWLNAGKSPSSEDYIPPSGSMDVPLFVSWDGYNHDKAKTVEDTFGKARDLTDRYGYAFAISETASDADEAGWVNAVTDWAVEQEALYLCYWPSQTSEPGAPDFYPPPEAMAAFADVALRYGGTPK